MKKIRSILLYADAEFDASILEEVVNISRIIGAKLTLAGVVKSAKSAGYSRGGIDLREVERLLTDERKLQLDEIARSVGAREMAIGRRVFLGDPADALIRAVVREGYDFLVKAPDPAHGFRQHLFGSVDMRLMRACPCTVVITHAKPGGYSRCAVAAVDYPGEDEIRVQLNASILEFAEFGLDIGLTDIYVVHACSLYGESLLADGHGDLPSGRLKAVVEQERAKRQQWLQDLIDAFRAGLTDERKTRFRPKLELLHGDPSVVIPQRIQELDADVLAIGTVARNGLRGFLIGNTAEAILSRIHCTVVTHKPDGFVSPLSPN